MRQDGIVLQSLRFSVISDQNRYPLFIITL